MIFQPTGAGGIGIVDPRHSLELIRQSQAVNSSALGNLKTAESEITKALDKAAIHKSEQEALAGKFRWVKLGLAKG